MTDKKLGDFIVNDSFNYIMRGIDLEIPLDNSLTIDAKALPQYPVIKLPYPLPITITHNENEIIIEQGGRKTRLDNLTNKEKKDD